jgi:phage terminase large subunit-like protein
LNAQLHVGVRIFQGENGVFEAGEAVMELAEQFSIAEVNYDPWRASVVVRAFEQRGLKTTAFPWSDARVIPAAGQLYQAIIDRKLVHPGDPELDRHIAAVVGKATRRGLRIDKAAASDQIDAGCALTMAFEAATAPPPEPSKVLGWL